MRELLILAVHLLVTCAKLLRSGGARAVAAEFLLLKHQLMISNRSRQRAPNLTTLDLWSAIIRVVFVSALPLSSDHALALALAMEYS